MAGEEAACQHGENRLRRQRPAPICSTNIVQLDQAVIYVERVPDRSARPYGLGFRVSGILCGLPLHAQATAPQR